MAPQYKAGETVRYKPKSGLSTRAPSCPLGCPDISASTGPSSDAYEAEITGTIKNIQASQDDSRYEVRQSWPHRRTPTELNHPRLRT
jgi:hypothetical protein